MNQLIATVSKIDTMDKLSIVTFMHEDTQMRMMSLGLNSKISKDTQVKLGFKSSSIMLAKNLSGDISTSNQLPCIIVNIDSGELLSSIELNFGEAKIQSLITKESSIKMNLQKGDKVLALIKASELSILEVLS